METAISTNDDWEDQAMTTKTKKAPIEAEDQKHQPTRMQRFWRRMGFGEVTPPTWPKDRNYSVKYLVSTVKVRLSWPERLQLLISGNLNLAVSTKTRPQVQRSQSMWAMSIAPPGDHRR